MPIIEGEKWACSSCIKGHRVSGCNHTDRELHHINPKGRPVKQCEHCRGARKSKSHHAKCDCGDRKDKHKDKADPKAHDNRCCCHSGSKCICGIKKDTPGLRLDTSKQTLHDMRARPKVTATHSDPALTVFANGHHRPCHRSNNSAHISGAPYKLPRPHTLHGPAEFAAFAQGNTYSQAQTPAPRSMDTLSVSNNEWYTMFGSAARSTDALPLTPLTGSLDAGGFNDALFSSRSSTFTSGGLTPGGQSPTESHLSDTLSAPWPWAVNRNFNYSSLTNSPSQDCLPLESDWAIPSANLTNPTWTAGDLPLDPSKLSDNLVQPISQSGESKQSAPGLTASSSPSEMGEPVLFSDLEYRGPPSTASENLFWEDTPVYRIPSHESRPPTSAPQCSTPEPQGLNISMSKGLSHAAAIAVSSGPNMYSQAESITMPNSSMEDFASNDPWMLDQSNSGYTGYSTFDLPSSYPANWL